MNTFFFSHRDTRKIEILQIVDKCIHIHFP